MCFKFTSLITAVRLTREEEAKTKVLTLHKNDITGTCVLTILPLGREERRERERERVRDYKRTRQKNLHKKSDMTSSNVLNVLPLARGGEGVERDRGAKKRGGDSFICVLISHSLLFCRWP